MERPEVSSVPVAERRVHGLVFDLSAYGIDLGELEVTAGFSLKLFGSTRQRFLSLALPRTELCLVRHMRLVLDRSMMRNIFVRCYNLCRCETEPELSDAWAIRHLQFSPRLYDIKLFQRLETVAYFQETDMFVLVEGEAARCCNFHTGMDVNLSVSGLAPLSSVLSRAACAVTEADILSLLLAHWKHSHNLARQFIRHGLKQDIFS
ncbi:uncharacterized protein LOC101848604 [Aplysia californica]|uniref:Uncharacterized protein LOC101848604 n=1 Tax=Aplysia californica TaxID=6500 RepID=A0ABM0JZS7_APLCA|nr:uncharacterized protein LOC101848604 [Aplysia californica]